MAWPVERLPCFLYQMLFALFTSQREIGLRHYDIKLLNFFLARPPPPPGEEAADADAASSVWMHYGVCGHEHRFELSRAEPSLAMLADFGTADVSPSTMGQPISLKHFTTVENTPPDFLLLGTHAHQDFKADSFALGLCWLHLLTGRARTRSSSRTWTCPRAARCARSRLDCAGRWAVRAGARAHRELWRRRRGVDHPRRSTDSFACLARRTSSTARTPMTTRSLPPRTTAPSSTALHGRRCARGSTRRRARASLARTAASGRSRAARRSRSSRRRSGWQAARRGQMLRGLTRFEPTVRWSACRAMRSEVFAPYLAEEAAAPPPGATLRFTDYLHDEQED